jgi:hypothetical protein
MLTPQVILLSKPKQPQSLKAAQRYDKSFLVASFFAEIFGSTMVYIMPNF